MSFFSRLFGKPDPRSVYSMPDNPRDFISALCRRKYWRDIDRSLLLAIGENAAGDMDLLQAFVFVSEVHGLVQKNFIPAARERHPVFASPLCSFSRALYLLGSRMCQNFSDTAASDQPLSDGLKACLMFAGMAFESSVLCDPVHLAAYAGNAMLQGGIRGKKEAGLQWCRKYRDAEERLLNTPDTELSWEMRALKKAIQDPEESVRMSELMNEKAPGLAAEYPLTGDVSMRDVIEQLEERLLSS